MEFKHVPVLFNEVTEGMNIKPDGIYVDGTTGGGGHSGAIAERLTSGHLYCFDRDTEALKAAGEHLAPYAEKISFIHDNYANAVSILKGKGVAGADGILLSSAAMWAWSAAGISPAPPTTATAASSRAFV